MTKNGLFFFLQAGKQKPEALLPLILGVQSNAKKCL
jgi:hypothetical protein